MADGFLYKLGEFKAERTDKGYTKIHNETYFKIAKKLGAEACHFYTALSTYAYGSSVTVFPKMDVLAERLGVSRDTIKRWKKKLIDENIIRAVPCVQLNGMRTVDVILFNATYPEIPEEWHTFAPNGFVMVEGKPILFEEWERTLQIAKNHVTKQSAKLHLPKNQRVQNCTHPDDAVAEGEQPEKTHNEGGCKIAPTEKSEGAKLHLAHVPEIVVTARDQGQFFEGEENKDKEKKDIVVVVNRLTTYFQQKLGEVPEKDVRNGVLVMLEDDKASEEDIRKAIDYTSGQRVKKNVIGYVRRATKDRYWERVAVPQKPKKQETRTVVKANPVRDERYTEFYQLFPDE